MPGFTFASIAKAIGIRGGIAIALGLALLVVMWRADTISAQRDAYRDKLAASEARLAVSNASIDALKKTLGDYVGAGKASAVAQSAALAAQAPKSAELQREAAVIRADAAKGAEGCDTPESVRKAKGL